MNAEDGILLSTDLSSSQSVPYFLWDEPMTVAEFRQRLETASAPEQTRLLAKLLRESRNTDVWLFISPAEVWRRWPALAPQSGPPPRLLGISIRPMAETGANWWMTDLLHSKTFLQLPDQQAGDC